MKLFTDKREESSLAFGGQALIEGVMIRSQSNSVICVRQPNKEIVMHTDTISSLTERYRGLNLPFIRGIVTLFETFYFGFKALYFSANAALEGDEQFTYKEFTVAIALALLLISFFFTIPFLLTSLLNLSGWIFNLVEALIRFSLFTLYLVLISKWGEFQRV